jgi:hypothetical protein
MKRLTFLLALLVAVPLAFSPAQERATLSSYRISPKPGKEADLKKAITNHAAKYHTGNWKWRVFMVLSGPESRAFMINEGPNTWTTMEGRGDINDEHTRDYEANVVPLVETAYPESYLMFQKELSTDSAVGPLKKALLRHFYTKPGKSARLFEYMKTWKKVWEKMGLKVTVWTSFFSGEFRMVVAYRLPKGWVDLERPVAKELREGFDEIEGAGAYARYLEDLDNYVDRISEEMIELLPDVGSK